MQPLAILPLLVVLVGAVVALVVGIFLPRRRQTWNAAFALAVLATAAILAAADLDRPPGIVFDGTFAADGPFLHGFLVVLAATAGCLALAVPTFRDDAREAEFYALLLFSALGGGALLGAHDVMEIVLGVLLVTVPSYAMVAWRRSDAAATEAVMKYYLFGALMNIGLIYGLVLLYGLNGGTLLSELEGSGGGVLGATAAVLVLVGLGFKIGSVPSHFWIPDAYQGTTVPVAAYLSIVPKIAAVLALARLTAALPDRPDLWAPLISVLAAVSMTWGNLAMFRQTDLRRLLGYSTVAQAGYLMIAVALPPAVPMAMPALLFYFAAYAAANLGAFAVLGATGRTTIEAHRGLIRRRPGLAAAMAVALLSLTGIPPLAGFVGKLAIFVAAVDGGWAWLAVVGLANSALSLYPYLRVVAPMAFGAPEEAAPPADAIAGEPYATAVAYGATAASIGLGLAAFWFLAPGASFG